jgi:predicted  nucleic acid-binding Zn-ribbon protein
MHKHICLYCGKEFESRRVVAGFCPGKSTCRAGYHKRHKREEAQRLAALEKDKAEAGADAMLARLRQVDPKAAALVDQLRSIAGAECVELAIKAGLQLNAALAKVEGLPMK